jgi:hypothetical protein
MGRVEVRMFLPPNTTIHVRRPDRMPPATEQLRSRPTGLEPDFIELPIESADSGLEAGAASTPPRTAAQHVRPRKPARTTKPQRAVLAPMASTTAKPEVDDRPWQQRVVGWIKGEDGAGYGISLIVHIVVIAVLAIPVIRHFEKEPDAVAVSTQPFEEGGGGFGGFVDTELAEPLEAGGSQPISLIPEHLANDTLPIANALFSGSGKGNGGGGTGNGTGDGGFGGGIGPFVPGNAVRKGSFAAWTIPIFNERYPKRFGDPDPQPGDSPRPKQAYHIIIQIKVPRNKTTYALVNDLSGTVVGTDGYRQKIPENTQVLGADGKTFVSPRGSVRVKNGLVHIQIYVPGAERLVRDTIQISSKMLKEEQTLELVFEEASQRDE